MHYLINKYTKLSYAKSVHINDILLIKQILKSFSSAKFLLLYVDVLQFTTKLLAVLTQVWEKAKIRNRYNQVSHLTQDTVWESDKTHKKNITYRRAKKSALSQQVTTKLHDTDKTIWQRQTKNK